MEYTSIEQSKKLIELGLNIETADMVYASYNDVMTGKKEYRKWAMELTPMMKIETERELPCWSLAALLGVLPKGTNISTPKPINALGYCCWNQYDEIYADNPIDACYEMIIKLNEQKLL